MKLFGSYKKRSRSASLQLSINAIVILVMAMAVLGLGFGLIRGVFSTRTAKLSNSLTVVELLEPATAEKPLTNIDNLEIQRNKENTISIGFYNAQSTCSGSNENGVLSAYLNLSCVKKGDNLIWDVFDYLPVDVGQGESKTIGAIVKTNATAGSYPCLVTVYCGKDADGNKIVAASAAAFMQVTSQEVK